jgi:cytochrome b561
LRSQPQSDPEDLSYSPLAQALHWVIVALLVIQFTLAWTMPEIGRGTKPETLINLHLSFGLVILLLAAIRLVARTILPPPPIAGLLNWQLLASRLTHGLLYLLLFVIPLLGWMNASWRGWTITVFSIVKLPGLVVARAAAPVGAFSWGWTGDVHTVLSYGLIGLVALHVLAVLFHHFLLRDRTLARMLPGEGRA